MMRRLIRRAVRRLLPGRCPEEAIRSADAHMRRAESHLTGQRKESEAAVNFLYDRIAPNDRSGAQR